MYTPPFPKAVQSSLGAGGGLLSIVLDIMSEASLKNCVFGPLETHTPSNFLELPLAGAVGTSDHQRAGGLEKVLIMGIDPSPRRVLLKNNPP